MKREHTPSGLNEATPTSSYDETLEKGSMTPPPTPSKGKGGFSTPKKPKASPKMTKSPQEKRVRSSSYLASSPSPTYNSVWSV